MKATYNIAYIDFGKKYEQGGHSGIERKKRAQISELSKIGKVKRITYSPKERDTIFTKITKRLPFFPSMVAYHYSSDDLDNTDIVYYRRHLIDRYAIKLLKDIKVRNPHCLVFFEIPTYPYDKELKDFLKLPLLLKERWNRRKLHAYVDRIVTLSNDPILFGIPTIKIINGIDFSITSQRDISSEEDGVVHGVIVGVFQFWHGLDRLVAGLKKYYEGGQQQREFVLHVVGPLDEISHSKQLTQDISDLSVAGHVKVYGKLDIEEVEEVYNKVSLGFDVFGLHRRFPGQVCTSIKSKEYGAKGLPIIGGSAIDYIPEEYPYFYRVKEDETPVDIESVIDFHDRIYANGYEEVAKEIREFTQTRCSSEAMMKPVLDYCLEHFVKKTK